MKAFIIKCYQSWIEENIPKDELVGNCTMWARVMNQAFPELILVGGYVVRNKVSGDDDFFAPPYPSFLSCSYHEYLITEDGDIVDPTAIQFDALIGKDNWRYNRCDEHLLYGGCNES